MTTIIDGNEVGDAIRNDLEHCIATLEEEGVTPGLATVLMSDDPASSTYVSMKQRACEEIGIEGIHRELDPEAPADRLFDEVGRLNEDPTVHGILVQMPVPDHVDGQAILRHVDPRKDVDGFHPENVGRLVAGDARFKPATPHGIQRLLAAADVETEGADAVVVGRSNIVGKPMANLLLQKGPQGNATTTVCHSRTTDLGEKTRQADILIAAVGIPRFIEGDMIAEGATVIDVGVNRVDADNDRGYELVGDVDFDAARDRAGAITPVPGGVGPMTITMLLWNTVKAAADLEDVDVTLP